MKLSSTETELIGRRKIVDGRVRSDAICKRIEWLITNCLGLTDAENTAGTFSRP